MGYTIAQKIIKNHLVCGEMVAGKEIGLKIGMLIAAVFPLMGTLLLLYIRRGIKRGNLS